MNWRIKPLDAIMASAEKKSLHRSIGGFQLTMLGVWQQFNLTAKTGQWTSELNCPLPVIQACTASPRF
jgi:hypothetical protein